MDYDRYSDTLPLLGTAVAQAMDGADAHATPSIHTSLYLWKSLTFVANISGAVQYGAVSWQLQDSPDGTNWTSRRCEPRAVHLAQRSHQHEQGVPLRLHRQAAVRQSGVHKRRCRDRPDHGAARARDVEAGLAIRLRGHGLRER